ncbi:MAG: hypothetical protein A2X94_17480 [Bdellovibrionales bacterium GWB1_55_8]|nr:MAG: hypothetical protein A2X94_17480 [Bdellovibrionales bacterium GWB1_55_8]
MERRAVIQDLLSRHILFVTGKGGVGKTAVSLGIARAFAKKKLKTLWITFEDPLLIPGGVREIAPGLIHLNACAAVAFEEYVTMKIGASAISRVFVKNKLVQYLAQAAPGIHELVLLGKVWHERHLYDRVVADLPATGHGLAMFQSTQNFSVLFQGGPVHRDAVAMMQTFGDPAQCGHLLVALPEEMPLREALELENLLHEIFPDNAVDFLVNRVFPKTAQADPTDTDPPSRWTSPLAFTAHEYIEKRAILEDFNLRLWRERGLKFAELSYMPPGSDISEKLSCELIEKGYV